MIRATLPYPPTVNHYWQTTVVRRGRRHVPHVFVSNDGRNYQENVARLLRGVQAITGDVRLTVVVHSPDSRRRDLDNVLKCLLDSLTHAGLWSDDSQVAELALVRGSVVPGGMVRIEATSMGYVA